MTDEDVIAAMERCGGSFIQALALAWRRADPDNRRILKDAFSPYTWMHYTELATLHAQRKDVVR